MFQSPRIRGLIVVSLVLLALPGCLPPATPVPPAATTTPPPTDGRPVTATPSPVPSPIPTTIPSPGAALSPTEIKYRVIDQAGQVFFCDPDYYPVARVLSEKEFEQRYAAIVQNTEEFQTILRHNGLGGKTTLTADQKQLVYAEHKKLNSINLTPNGAGYRFSLRTAQDKARGFVVEGVVEPNGAIAITKREATVTTCPICLAAATRIDTPAGPVAVEDLRPGMPIWTQDRSGKRQVAVVLKTAKRLVPVGVSLVHVVLEDGRTIFVSAGHPVQGNRTVGDLTVGDVLDGARVTLTEFVPYDGEATYDVLPSGATGLYWANAILLQSTLASP